MSESIENLLDFDLSTALDVDVEGGEEEVCKHPCTNNWTIQVTLHPVPEEANKAQNKGAVVRPIPTQNIALHGQVDLVDMQSMSRNEYRWIMVYRIISPNSVFYEPFNQI